MGPAVEHKSAQEGSMVFLIVSIIGALIFAVLLPLIVMLYIDTATMSAVTKKEVQKIHRMERKLEELKKEIEQEKDKK